VRWFQRLSGKLDARDKTVTVVLSGANADFGGIAEMVGKFGSPAHHEIG